MNENKQQDVKREVLTHSVNDCYSVHNLCNDGKYLFAVQHLFSKTAQYSDYINDIIMDFHFHSGYELEILISGEVEHIFDNKKEILRPNDFYIMSPDNIHAVKFAEGTDTVVILNIRFNDIILSDSINRFLKCNSFPMFGHVSDDFIAYLGMTFEKLSNAKEAMQEEDSYNKMLHKMFEAFLIYLVSASDIEKSKKITIEESRNLNMYEAIKYVREHYKEKIKVGELAKRYGYSTNYFSVKFKSTTQKSLVEYINDMRLVEAYKRVLSSDESVYSICLDVGYSNLTYFYKKFKEKFNCLPEGLRKHRKGVTSESFSE